MNTLHRYDPNDPYPESDGLPMAENWEENGIAPQVTFEILSPLNTALEMKFKKSFYD